MLYPFHRRTVLTVSALVLLLAGLKVWSPLPGRAQDVSSPRLLPQSPTGSGPTDIVEPSLPPRQRIPVPIPTQELLVFLRPGTNVNRFAADHGLTYVSTLRSDKDAYVLAAGSPQRADAILAALPQDERVREAYLNEHTRYVREAFTPNDPYFHQKTPAGWNGPGQWYLVNEATPGRDSGVQGAWNRDITGQNVILALVDDDLQTTHPDLAPNYDAADSFDFGQNDSDPDPVYSGDNHGTAVAGIMAARGDNGIGITGAAPYAGLAGLRVDFPNQTTAMFVDATLYHSSGNNTSIKVVNHSYGDPNPYDNTAATANATITSANAGTIHCFAAGNERGGSGEDANKKSDQSCPSAITVAAMGSNAKYASYSCFGACVFVASPSSGGPFGILTTDRAGADGYNTKTSGDSDGFPDLDYTSTFGGTSAATPVVTGVMALGKQVQPALNVRFAKHLLALSSTVVDASDATTQSDGGWKTNAAGYKFNQNYGFGLINADKFTQMAVQYGGVSPLTTATTGTQTVNASIPDNDTTGISQTFTLSSTTPLEEVLVTLNITHPHRGDVEAYLTSPSGTTGRLMLKASGDGGANIVWTFTSNTFWGENPQGTWTLTVRDVIANNTGTWNSYKVTARMGTLLPANTSLTAANASGAVGQTIPLTATLRRATDNAPLPNKTVSFTLGTTTGSATTDANGVATFDYTAPESAGTGNFSFKAAFAGDSQVNASSGSATLTVGKADTSLLALNASGRRKKTISLRATLQRATDNALLANRTLTFKIDGGSVGTATTDSTGTTSLSYTISKQMALGNHTLTVEFGGDTLHNASSGSATLLVNPASSSNDPYP